MYDLTDATTTSIIDDEDDGQLELIIGISVTGCVVVIVIVFVIAFLYIRSRRRKIQGSYRYCDQNTYTNDTVTVIYLHTNIFVNFFLQKFFNLSTFTWFSETTLTNLVFKCVRHNGFL